MIFGFDGQAGDRDRPDPRLGKVLLVRTIPQWNTWKKGDCVSLVSTAIHIHFLITTSWE